MIDNWANKSRSIDYSSLRFGTDVPSDLDGLMVLPSLTIAIEYKCGESPVRGKQRMVLETVVNDAEAAGKRAAAIVARYYDRNPQNTVNAALCLVTQIYTKGAWYDIRKCGLSLRQTMEKLVEGGK